MDEKRVENLWDDTVSKKTRLMCISVFWIVVFNL